MMKSKCRRPFLSFILICMRDERRLNLLNSWLAIFVFVFSSSIRRLVSFFLSSWASSDEFSFILFFSLCRNVLRKRNLSGESAGENDDIFFSFDGSRRTEKEAFCPPKRRRKLSSHDNEGRREIESREDRETFSLLPAERQMAPQSPVSHCNENHLAY